MLIFGIGEFAAVASYYYNGMGQYTQAYTIDGAGNAAYDKLFHGKQLIEWKYADPSLSQSIYIAIGYSNLNENRAAKLAEARAKGFKPASFVSSDALCFSRDIGEHCFILEANVIQPFVTIGENCVIWSMNHIGHHTHIGKNCFISSGCVISGGCDIGDNTFIGVNSSIADHVKVGHHAIITMGSRVTKDVPEYGVWDGNELRKITSDRVKL